MVTTSVDGSSSGRVTAAVAVASSLTSTVFCTQMSPDPSRTTTLTDSGGPLSPLLHGQLPPPAQHPPVTPANSSVTVSPGATADGGLAMVVATHAQSAAHPLRASATPAKAKTPIPRFMLPVCRARHRKAQVRRPIVA